MGDRTRRRRQQSLRDQGHERVAFADVDTHHGKGTSAIFYERDDVYCGFVHVDPGAGWFPHYVGHADEQGTGDGLGVNQNIPLTPVCRWGWMPRQTTPRAHSA